MAQPIERNQDATVYVGNLDDRCSDTLVWELMAQAGPVGKLSSNPFLDDIALFILGPG